jgi:uncharacterized protein (PEP-CTERM system associated)
MARPEAIRPGRRGQGLGLLGLAALSCGAMAQDALSPSAPSATLRPAWLLEPSITLRQTFTNNVRQEADGRKDAVTEISPRIRLLSQAGRLQGSLDYALTGVLYARTASENTVQHALAARGRGELVDRRLFLDANAQVSRVSRNALDSRPVDPSVADDDQTTTASVQLSPSLIGALGSWADYELRLGLNATRTEDSPADSNGNSASLLLASPGSAARRLGWNLALSHQANRFLSGSRTESDSLIATLLYGFSPEWRLSVRAGREFNDVLSARREGYDSWGLGLRWTPSPRTSFEAEADDRYFGHSHSLRVQHRLARTVLSYSDSRDVSGDAGRGGSGELRTVYDLLFDLLASSVPDPAARSAAVDAYLLSNGLSRTSLAGGGFLTTSVSLQRRQQLAIAYTGVRSTLLLSVSRGRTESLTPNDSVLPGLPPGAGARQQALSLAVSHRLSPQSALTLQAGVDRSQSLRAGLAGATTSTRSLSGSWTLQMPRRAALSVTARRVLSDGTAEDTNESALAASLVKSF